MAKVKSIKLKRIQGQRLYNLSVRNDETFIVNDMLVHNCDGWLRPILIGNLRGREPKKYTPTKKAAQAIQFHEGCGCGVELSENKLIPPKQAQENAARGLELRRKWERGGTSVGIARARDISNGSNLSPDTISRMASFNRHRDNYRPEKKESDGGPTAGTIAWLLWGGNAGVDWALRESERLNKEEMQETQLVEIQDARPGNMQSIVVSKEKADSIGTAKEIAKEFGAKKLTVDETNSSYRFRQRNPSDFKKGSFRSKSIPEKGVTLIYGQLA